MALAVTLLPFSYEGNDDRFLVWNTSGHLMGYPRHHIIWMHFFYAWFESRLYMIQPQIEWRTWIFLLIHLISLTIICYCIVKTDHNRWSKYILLAIAYVWEMYNLTHFQFTTTAGLAATSGMLLIISKKKYVVGIILFLLGVLIRYHSAMFCGLMTAAIYPLVIARSGFDIKQFIPLVICMIGAFCLNMVDNHSYNKNPRLKEMRDYDILRSTMYDNSNNWRVYDHPPKGLTRQEITGTTQPLPYVSDSIWEHHEEYQGDYEFIPIEKIEFFLSTVDEYTSYKGVPGFKKIKNIPIQFHPFWILFVIGLLIIIGCIINYDSKKGKLYLVFIASMFLLANSLFALNKILNSRAIICGLLPMIWILLCIIPYKRRVTNIFASFALMLTLMFFVKKMPSTEPSELYKEQMELVEYGINHQGEYLYSSNLITPETGYPFGLRLLGLTKLSPYTISSVTKEMLDEGICLTIIQRNYSDEEIEIVKTQFADIIHENIIAEELYKNDHYILFRLKSRVL